MKLNPFVNSGHLKLELFCYGLRVDASCKLDKDARTVIRTRGGLGSGLELILPGGIYVNVPIVEPFAKKSPYILKKLDGQYRIYKGNKMASHVTLPKRPKFYDRLTGTGKKMSRIGVMQGTYLAIYAPFVCQFWQMKPVKNCKFCSVGLNLGKNEDEEKSVEEVLEVVSAAKKEEKITFVHFNSGFNYGEEVDDILPYVKSVKEKTGLLVGVQIPPQKEIFQYKRLKKAGADHISICIEFLNPKKFNELCPGKAQFLGQETFLEAIKNSSKIFGKGRVSGEIIVGLEPIEDSLKAIEEFAKYGAVSTVCVFRPCIGTDLEKINPPNPKTVAPVFAKMYEVCVKKNIPISIAPNIEVSLVILPSEGKFFVKRNYLFVFFSIKIFILKLFFYVFLKFRILAKTFSFEFQRVAYYWQLIRVFTLLPPFVGIFCSALIAVKVTELELTYAVIARIFMASLAAALLNGASNSLNQYYDLEIDKINKPQRPLARGVITKKNALIFSYSLYCLAIFSVILVSLNVFQTLVIFLIAAILTIAYSAPPIRTKRLTWGSNFTIAFTRGLLLFLAGWSVVGHIWLADPWLLGIVFGLFIFFIVPIKDLDDIKGDKKYSIKTMPIIYGPKFTKKFISLGFIIPLVLLFILANKKLISVNLILINIYVVIFTIIGIFLSYRLINSKSGNIDFWQHVYIFLIAVQLGLAAVYYLN